MGTGPEGLRGPSGDSGGLWVLLAETRTRRAARSQEGTGLSGCWLPPHLQPPAHVEHVSCGAGAVPPRAERGARIGCRGPPRPFPLRVVPLQCRVIVWEQKTTKLRGGGAVARCWLPPPRAPSPSPPARAALGGCRQLRARLAVLGEIGQNYGAE